MAELTVLESKLGEVLGLAIAAQEATQKVEGFTDDAELKRELKQMREEARETRATRATATCWSSRSGRAACSASTSSARARRR